MNAPNLSALESAIMAANPSGAAWSRADIRRAMSERDAVARFNVYRAAFGVGPVSSAVDFLTVGNWPNRKDGNAKLKKSDAVSAGVTFLPADGAARWAREVGPDALADFADDIGMSPVRVERKLMRLSLCPRSTAGCRAGCVVTTSGRAQLDLVQVTNRGLPWYAGTIARGRLVRSLFLALDPAAALRLMLAGIDRLAAVGRAHRLPRRWRLAIADDVRWEMVAPGLMTACRAGNVTPYAYTKFRPEDRPEPRGAAFTYSASERWTVAQILAAARNGHRVAVVLDTARGAELPAQWCGVPVVDGDATDDQSAHPRGVIVALRAKGAARGRFIFPTENAQALARMADEERRAAVRVTIGTR